MGRVWTISGSIGFLYLIPLLARNSFVSASLYLENNPFLKQSGASVNTHLSEGNPYNPNRFFKTNDIFPSNLPNYDSSNDFVTDYLPLATDQVGEYSTIQRKPNHLSNPSADEKSELLPDAADASYPAPHNIENSNKDNRFSVSPSVKKPADKLYYNQVNPLGSAPSGNVKTIPADPWIRESTGTIDIPRYRRTEVPSGSFGFLQNDNVLHTSRNEHEQLDALLSADRPWAENTYIERALYVESPDEFFQPSAHTYQPGPIFLKDGFYHNSPSQRTSAHSSIPSIPHTLLQQSLTASSAHQVHQSISDHLPHGSMAVEEKYYSDDVVDFVNPMPCKEEFFFQYDHDFSGPIWQGVKGHVAVFQGEAVFRGKGSLVIPFFACNDLLPRYSMRFIVSPSPVKSTMAILGNSLDPSTSSFLVSVSAGYLHLTIRARSGKDATKAAVHQCLWRRKRSAGHPHLINAPQAGNIIQLRVPLQSHYNVVTIVQEDGIIFLSANGNVDFAFGHLPTVTKEPLYIGAGASPVSGNILPLYKGTFDSFVFEKCPTRLLVHNATL